MEFLKIKEMVRNNILDEISQNEYDSLHNGKDKNTFFFKEEVLKRQLKLLTEMSSLDELDANVDFFNGVSSEDLKKAIDIIINYMTFSRNNNEFINNSIKYDKLKEELEKHFKDVSLNEIHTTKELKKLIEVLNSIINNFEKESSILKKKLNVVDFKYYDILFENVRTKRSTNLTDLLYFENYDSYIVKYIMKLKYELTLEKNKTFKFKKSVEKEEKLKEKILYYEKKLLDNINETVKFIYDLYNKSIELNLDLNEYMNVHLFYICIEDEIEEILKEYNEALMSLNKNYILLSRTDEKLFKNLNHINPFFGQLVYKNFNRLDKILNDLINAYSYTLLNKRIGSLKNNEFKLEKQIRDDEVEKRKNN